MYQLTDNTKEWDTEYLYTLLGDKRIFSSKDAQIIRADLEKVGALPDLGNNFDWATLCVGYCFATDIINKPADWATEYTRSNTEIPSFETCFTKEYARLWLVLLSDILFKTNPDKKVSKDDLYKLVEILWHTGAKKLWSRWEACKQYKPDDELAARQTFLNELVDLAVKNAGLGQNIISSGSPKPNEIMLDLNTECDRLKMTLDKTVGKGGSIQPEYIGVRYNCFRVQFDRFVKLESYHTQICSELGMGDDDLRYERIEGAANTWHINILRNQTTWQNFGKAEFQAALSQFSAHETFNLPVLIGINERGQPVFADLAKAVHSFVAGKTGSGKSVFVHSLLHSLLKLNTPKQVQVIILDPKKTEYQDFINQYQHIRDNKIITDTDEMDEVLRGLVDEVEQRNNLLQEQGKRNISELSEDLLTSRYILVVVDEVANLLSRNKEIEDLLCQLAEKARSAGVFLLLSTQTPNSESFSQRLRANITTRIAFSVVNARASSIVLDETGAENLAGSGDHLVKWNGGKIQFLHGYNV